MAIASAASPLTATWTAETSPTCAWRGKPGRSIAIRVSMTTTSASNTRSTATEATAAGSGTLGVSRVNAYARTNSPTRAGTRLLIITPMAVARHKGPNGSFAATGSKIGRHRRARMGITAVAAADDTTKSGRFERRRVFQTSSNRTPWSAHQSSATLIPTPATPFQLSFTGRRSLRAP